MSRPRRGSEYREFEQTDIDEMWTMARRRVSISRDAGFVHMNRMRRDRIAAIVQGWMGEWAVADSLGIPRPRTVRDHADPGWDLVAPDGRLVQVRFRARPDGWLMCLDREAPAADVAVLVVTAGHPLAVRIAGAATVDRLHASHLADFGWGPTRYLRQDELDPWDEWRGALAPMRRPA